MKETKPLAIFGLITDIQYADIKDGYSYDGLRPRHYRESLTLTSKAVSFWKQVEVEQNQKMKLVLQLGDIIDVNCIAINKSKEALDLVLNELEKLFPNDSSQKLLHIWGNHEMYNFKRDELVNTPLNTAKMLGYVSKNIYSKANYYTYEVASRLRLICLDFYLYSALGRDESDDIYKQTIRLLREHNKNEDLNSPDDLSDADSKYLLFNGSLGDEQTKWLVDQLSLCKRENKKAIVCGHIPLDPRAGDYMCLAYDSEQVLKIFRDYKDTVVAYFAGHYHSGSYYCDKENGIQHFTFPAVLETPKDSNAFATFYVYEDKIKVNLFGDLTPYEIEY